MEDEDCSVCVCVCVITSRMPERTMVSLCQQNTIMVTGFFSCIIGGRQKNVSLLLDVGSKGSRAENP